MNNRNGEFYNKTGRENKNPIVWNKRVKGLRLFFFCGQYFSSATKLYTQQIKCATSTFYVLALLRTKLSWNSSDAPAF